MNFKITSKPNFKKLAKDITIKKDNMNDFALDLRTALLRRIKSGEDIKNNPFKKYSNQTSESKRKIGKSTKVNMEDSGQMLRGFRVLKATKNSAELGLTLHKKIGYYHQVGSGKLPEREWFGVDKRNEKIFYKRFLNIIGKKVDRWLSQ